MKLIYSIYRSNNEFSLYCKNALEWSVWNDKIVIDDYRFVLFNTYMRNAILMDNSEMSYNKFLNKINGDLNIYAQNSA